MTVQYQMTEQEAVRGILKIRMPHPWFRRLRLGAVVAGTALLVHFLSNPRRQVDAAFWFACVVACLAAALVVIVYEWYLRRSMASYVHHNAPLYTSACTLTFDEAGLAISSPSIKQELAWNVFTHRTEDECLIYLYTDRKGVLLMVPKRAFDPASLRDFRRCGQSFQQT